MSDLAGWITAGAAVVYTFGTFLLWRTTKESVDAMKRSLDTTRAAFKLNFLHAYVDAGGEQGVMGRLLASQTDRVKAHALDRLLRVVFAEEYEEMKAALREKPKPSPPEVPR